MSLQDFPMPTFEARPGEPGTPGGVMSAVPSEVASLPGPARDAWVSTWMESLKRLGDSPQARADAERVAWGVVRQGWDWDETNKRWRARSMAGTDSDREFREGAGGGVGLAGGAGGTAVAEGLDTPIPGVDIPGIDAPSPGEPARPNVPEFPAPTAPDPAVPVPPPRKPGRSDGAALPGDGGTIPGAAGTPRPAAVAMAEAAREIVRDERGRFAVSDFTAGEINKHLDRLDADGRKHTDEMISGGRGHERPSDWAEKTDPLSAAMNLNAEKRRTLRDEIERRYGPGAPSRLPKGFGPIRAREAMDGLAAHFARKYGDSEHFFSDVAADPELDGYDADARKAIAAVAHKLVVGRWPSEKAHEGAGVNERGRNKEKESVMGASASARESIAKSVPMSSTTDRGVGGRTAPAIPDVRDAGGGTYAVPLPGAQDDGTLLRGLDIPDLDVEPVGRVPGFGAIPEMPDVAVSADAAEIIDATLAEALPSQDHDENGYWSYGDLKKEIAYAHEQATKRRDDGDHDGAARHVARLRALADRVEAAHKVAEAAEVSGSAPSRFVVGAPAEPPRTLARDHVAAARDALRRAASAPGCCADHSHAAATSIMSAADMLPGARDDGDLDGGDADGGGMLLESAWDPDMHPRDENGQFTSSAGGSSRSTADHRRGMYFGPKAADDSMRTSAGKASASAKSTGTKADAGGDPADSKAAADAHADAAQRHRDVADRDREVGQGGDADRHMTAARGHRAEEDRHWKKYAASLPKGHPDLRDDEGKPEIGPPPGTVFLPAKDPDHGVHVVGESAREAVTAIPGILTSTSPSAIPAVPETPDARSGASPSALAAREAAVAQ